MKTSILAVATAFALTFGATSVSFSQDTATPATPEECLVDQGAGATAPGDAISSGGGGKVDTATSDDPPAEGLEPALDETPIVCPDAAGTDDDDSDDDSTSSTGN